jgi:hypothetical protein
VLSEREQTMAEFADYLRTTNNRDGRPYEEKTIEAYLIPCRNQDKWLTASGIEGDFTVADTALLNWYFRDYYLEHGQGGTHTLQRNLIQLFNYLQREHGHPTPYGEGLSRYAEVKGRPKTLGADFVDELLEVTGGGQARDFETARDHAMIGILRSEGIRRSELLGMPPCGQDVVDRGEEGMLWGQAVLREEHPHPAGPSEPGGQLAVAANRPELEASAVEEQEHPAGVRARGGEPVGRHPACGHVADLDVVGQRVREAAGGEGGAARVRAGSLPAAAPGRSSDFDGMHAQ